MKLKLYHTVIDDVIAGVRDPFLDEGVDEQVLQELKQVWTNKLMASKAVEMTPDPAEQPVPPPALTNNPKTSNKSGSKSKASRAAQAGECVLTFFFFFFMNFTNFFFLLFSCLK